MTLFVLYNHIESIGHIVILNDQCNTLVNVDLLLTQIWVRKGTVKSQLFYQFNALFGTLTASIPSVELAWKK